MSNGTKIELPPQYVKELVNLLDKNKKIILDEENDDNSSLEILVVFYKLKDSFCIFNKE